MYFNTMNLAFASSIHSNNITTQMMEMLNDMQFSMMQENQQELFKQHSNGFWIHGLVSQKRCLFIIIPNTDWSLTMVQ